MDSATETATGSLYRSGRPRSMAGAVVNFAPPTYNPVSSMRLFVLATSTIGYPSLIPNSFPPQEAP